MEKILKSFFLFLFIVVISPSSKAQSKDKLLRIPLHSSTISLNPAGIQDQSSLWVSRQVNCQLIRSNSGNLTMEAAESLRFIDPRTLLVTLRDDVFFHDNSQLTSDDVITTFEHLRKNRFLFRSIFGWVERIEKIDNKNFKILLNEANPQFLTVLSSPNYSIFKKEFILAAAKEPNLWDQPLGCGQYRVDRFNRAQHILNLRPKNPDLPYIEFKLLEENQILLSEIENYDIVGLTLIGNVDELRGYRIEKIFDPYHIFLGLNTRLSEWQSKENRCALFSQFSREKVLQIYGEDVEPATDILPRGILGYTEGINYPLALSKNFNASYLPPNKNKKFCLSILSVSVPLEHRKSYVDMFSSIFRNSTQRYIDDPKEFGRDFAESNCDALVLGLKSNVLDGYEYLLMLADDSKVNFTGYVNSSLQEQINVSQSVVDNSQKSALYQEISARIRNECIYYPILTIPMKKIYVKDTRHTPGLGEVPLNEYFLGQVQ